MKTNGKILLAAVALLGLMTFQLAVSANSVAAAEYPTYFKITVIAPTNNPARVQHAQVTVQEFWKIGIKADLVLVGWDILIPRMFESVGFTTYDAGGFDIGFVGWTGSVTDPAALRQFFHSAGINKATGASNYYPIDIPALDDLLDNMQAEPDIPTRRGYVKGALDYIIWEYSPVTALYQTKNPYALDADVRGFHAQRAAMGGPNIAEMYYETSGDTTFLFASPSRFIDLIPMLSNSYYDNLMYSPAWSSLYERDNLLNYVNIFAASPPIPIGTDDLIADECTTVTSDSPYDGKTTWGLSPNIDTAKYSATKTAADLSMFLINLKPNIPWHDGYGYDLGEPGYITADDLLFTMSYYLNTEIPCQTTAIYQGMWGTDSTKAIEKVNETMVKINIRGPKENGQFADYYDCLSMMPYPQHLLDPTFDATTWGGGVGKTPDGTKIPAYADQRDYGMNTGALPTLQAGPYKFISWTEATSTASLVRFEDWGGNATAGTTLWEEGTFASAYDKGIVNYAVTVIDMKSQAEIQLETEVIDGIDYNFQMGKDVPYLESKTNIQVISFVDAGMQSMGFNCYHEKLSDRFVRLAIAHVIPRAQIVSYILGGLGEETEVLGIAKANPFYPDEEEWLDIGLPTALNTLASDGETMLEFQGHISYNLEKAWALMEMAGYDMSAFYTMAEETETETEDGDSPLPILPVLLAVVGLGVVRLVRKKRD